jgi:hypothetical protein
MTPTAPPTADRISPILTVTSTPRACLIWPTVRLGLPVPAMALRNASSNWRSFVVM